MSSLKRDVSKSRSHPIALVVDVTFLVVGVTFLVVDVILPHTSSLD